MQLKMWNSILLAGCVVFASGAGVGSNVIATEPTTEAHRENEPLPWYLESAKSADYAGATAHDPKFGNTSLWNDDARASYYARQPWPAGRVLVWANPGSGANEGWKAEYWLENGRPATEPICPESNLVFPDHTGGNYWVRLTDGRKYQPAAFRHVTIGRGAALSGHLATHGNVWVKAGGIIENMDQSLGAQHTFFRNDNMIDRWDRRGMSLVDHFYVRKAPNASVEFIGIFRSEDRWQVDSGLMIVAPASEIGMGNRTDPLVRKDGAIAILGGSYLTRRSNIDWGTDLIVEGRLSGGLPDRPLTSDARLGVGWKSKGIFLGTTGSNRKPGPHDMGLRIESNARLDVYTVDPEKARLVINCSKRDNDWGQMEIISRGHPLHGEPLIAKLKELPRRTDVKFLGSVTWRGLMFDDILAGGIHTFAMPELTGPNAPAFGGNNVGTPSQLFTIISGE